MSEAYKSLAIKVAIAILTSLATRFHLQDGIDSIPAIASDGVDLAIACYAFYRSNGMKLVPHSSVAMSVHTIADNYVTMSDLKPGKTANIRGTVVGSLFLALVVFSAHHARAQTVPAQATPAATSVVSAAQSQLYSALNAFFGVAGGIIQTDLSLASADALAQTPPNTQAAACWQAIAKLPVTAIPAGAGLAYLKQKYIDFQALYMPINLNCGSTAPLLMQLFDQFMFMASAQKI
jgi:hypothetical protein